MKYSAISTRYSCVTNSCGRQGQQQTSAVVSLLQIHKVCLICPSVSSSKSNQAFQWCVSFLTISKMLAKQKNLWQLCEVLRGSQSGGYWCARLYSYNFRISFLEDCVLLGDLKLSLKFIRITVSSIMMCYFFLCLYQ